AAARGLLEQAEAATALATARVRMAASAQAVDQSTEAHRIVTRRYDGGLATVVELFDAAAEETAARLADADARYQFILALARSRRATGQDPADLAGLDEMEP
ncbi:MAG TPA: TolC family protein, partial [Gemmatimonadales bacterium]|nr:TolC family protein [Gemmatimonadales bacterium]